MQMGKAGSHVTAVHANGNVQLLNNSFWSKTEINAVVVTHKIKSNKKVKMVHKMQIICRGEETGFKNSLKDEKTEAQSQINENTNMETANQMQS